MSDVDGGLSTQHTCQHNILNVLIDSELQTLRIHVRGFVNKHLTRNLLWVGGLRVHSANKIKLLKLCWCVNASIQHQASYRPFVRSVWKTFHPGKPTNKSEQLQDYLDGFLLYTFLIQMFV